MIARIEVARSGGVLVHFRRSGLPGKWYSSRKFDKATDAIRFLETEGYELRWLDTEPERVWVRPAGRRSSHGYEPGKGEPT